MSTEMEGQESGRPHKAIYGPVPSWRLGRSLGVDLVCGPKACPFDCIYCQLGTTQRKLTQRTQFVATSRIVEELEALPPLEVDFVTFSGIGEPTLASNLGEAIAQVSRRLRWPVAVLTNSSLMNDPVVRAELCLADVVVAKLDASDEGLLQRVNRPASGITFEPIFEGLRALRREHRGRLAIQVMFCRENQTHADAIAAAVRELQPDEVQLNTPLRPSPTPPLSRLHLERIREAFPGLPAVSVYEARRVIVCALDAAETATRRPEAGAPSGGLL